MTKDYDLHITDRLAYNTDGYQNGEWEIVVYKMFVDKEKRYIPESSSSVTKIVLSNEEATRLTLGLEEDEGGDRNNSDDFAVGIEEFFDTYTDIPERVEDLLRTLPEYEMRIDG